MGIAVLVVGMGRSGSSAMTRVLSLCGAALPEHLMAPNVANPRGYWEAQNAVDLNDEFLARNGSSWYDAGLALQTVPRSDLVGADDFQDKITACIHKDYGDQPLIVLKDPRISGLLPFWVSGLLRAAYKATAVLVFRSPDSVAASLQARDGLDPLFSRALWLKYNLLAERNTRRLPRCFVDFNELSATGALWSSASASLWTFPLISLR